jgi:hypothetical protein
VRMSRPDERLALRDAYKTSDATGFGSCRTWPESYRARAGLIPVFKFGNTGLPHLSDSYQSNVRGISMSPDRDPFRWVACVTWRGLDFEGGQAYASNQGFGPWSLLTPR